jgi:hypothetical protein
MNRIFILHQYKRHLVARVMCLLCLQLQAQIVKAIDNKGSFVDVLNNQVTTSLTAPASPLEADTWIDTTTNTIKIWNGLDWVEISVPVIVSPDVGATAKITNSGLFNFNSSTTMSDKALGTLTFNEFNSDVSIDGTGFLINTAGTYQVNYSAVIGSTGKRVSTISQITAGGVLGGYSFSYVRNESSLDQSVISSTSVFQLNAGETVRLQARREGVITNPANALIGLAQLEITRLR